MRIRLAIASLVLMLGASCGTSAQDEDQVPVEASGALDGVGLDTLFASLASATAEESKVIERAIYEIWNEPGSDSMRLIFQRAHQAMSERRLAVAIEHLDDLVVLAPDFAEGWNARATAHFLAGNYQRSLHDVARTLEREPRHFGALSGRGLVYLALGRQRLALSSFREALEVHPHLEGPRRLARKLEQQLGQST